MMTTIFANGERNQATPFIFRDLKYKFFSFYTDNLKPEIYQKQSEVFEKLEIPLTQIVTSDLTTTGQFSWRDHELHLDYLLHTEDADVYCFFDIDCIPIRKDFLDYVHDYIKDGNTILGTAQVSAHIDRSHIYCAPSCLFLHKDVLNKLGWPSFMSNHRSDVGQEITRIAESKNVQVLYWFPSDVRVPKWNYPNGTSFGLGTTFDNLFYHEYEIRNTGADFFVAKCNEVIKSFENEF